MTKNEINKAANKMDKIIGDIDNIKRNMKQLDKKLKTRLQLLYIMILAVLKAVVILWRNIWVDYLSKAVDNLFEELEEARINLRSKIKESDSKTNKSIIKVNNIESDLETLKELLEKIKNYLNNSNNYQEIYKAVKCLIDQDDNDCK
ncbi:coiled-coil domain-containing protein [Borreliella bavariensis]|uniref:coiled-coil domain-containing protein n=1 Tax=Borreliella bavariensis TaxID=664662 RepID=UPI002D7E690E|nr:hypothetical protein [Borreliella bavariensis]